MTSGYKTGYCSLRIFISFVKLIVVINITEQSNVRSLNGSCASNSLTRVFLNFPWFYLPRSFESLYVSFPVLLKFILGLACGSSHGYRPFSKIPWYSRLLSTHSLASFFIDLSSLKSSRNFFFLNASNSSVSQIVHWWTESCFSQCVVISVQIALTVLTILVIFAAERNYSCRLYIKDFLS